ncbi:hypothetical protein J31TS4_43980 [Paenibacillus sp. J31TS4]|nr:hypothetical protein J31TS4_43980 [Paenibacillus sp. J31TS4]
MDFTGGLDKKGGCRVNTESQIGTPGEPVDGGWIPESPAPLRDQADRLLWTEAGPRERTGAGRRPIHVFFVAGIGTWQAGNMFGRAMEDLCARYRTAGIERVSTADLYPYGTMDEVPKEKARSYLYKQVWEVGKDLYKRYDRTRGGQAVHRAVAESCPREEGADLVLIGHSGGGVAAYNAALLLADDGYPLPWVVQVGSPYRPVRRSWRSRVFHLRQAGRIGDWVTWSGWPFLRRFARAVDVPILGGHPFYFSDQPKDGDGRSNLIKVMDQIWMWIGPGDAAEALHPEDGGEPSFGKQIGRG